MVIGFIDYFINEKNAKIKVLAFKKNDEWITSDIEIINEFPPYGFVFEDSFTHKFTNYYEKEFILFTARENPYSEGDKDKYKIEHLKERLSYYVVSHKGFMRDDYSIDMESLQEISEELPDKFYLKNEKGYYGPFKKVNGVIKAKTGKSVEFRKELNFQLSYDEKSIVFENPEPAKATIDVSTKQQLQKWFKDILSKSENPFLKSLLKNSNWKEIFLDTKIENIETEKSKLNRVISSAEDLVLTLKELELLASKSDDLAGIIEQKSELFKEEIISAKKHEIDEQIKTDKKELELLEKQKEVLKRELKDKKTQVSKAKKDLEYIEENKQRLILDFNVFQNLGNNTLAATIENEKQPEKKFFIEQSGKYSTHYPDKKAFDQSISKHLSVFKKQLVNPKFREAREIIATYNCSFSSSIELILSFIHATNNYKYLISQVEVKWLSFEDLWNNGLKDIWESAHENEEILHFLILRDINLSSPECFAGPLFDLDRGFRKRLPYDGRNWPKNFRVIATHLPTPEIGLHLYESTFSNWGALPHYEFEEAEIQEVSNQYGLRIKDFLDWMEDKEDMKNYLNEYISD